LIELILNEVARVMHRSRVRAIFETAAASEALLLPLATARIPQGIRRHRASFDGARLTAG
jgi:hypothetical protein